MSLPGTGLPQCLWSVAGSTRIRPGQRDCCYIFSPSTIIKATSGELGVSEQNEHSPPSAVFQTRIYLWNYSEEVYKKNFSVYFLYTHDFGIFFVLFEYDVYQKH